MDEIESKKVKPRQKKEMAADIFIWFRDWLKEKEILFFVNSSDQLEDGSFVSDLSVPILDYVSQPGKPSSTKSESKRNAMRRFYEYLKENNLYQDEEYPEFKKAQKSHYIDPSELKFQEEDEAFKRVKNAFEYYEDFEGEWIKYYGKWTEENAKHRFSLFKMEHRIDENIEINYTAIGPDDEMYFIAEMSFYVKVISSDVHSRGYGRNKIQAARRCTLNALQQLFDRRLLEEAIVPEDAEVAYVRAKPRHSLYSLLGVLLRKLKVPYVNVEDKSVEVSLLCQGRASRIMESQKDKLEDECLSGNEEDKDDKDNKEEKDDEQHSASEPEDEPMDSTNVDDNNLIPIQAAAASSSPEKNSVSIEEVTRAEEEAATRAEEEAAQYEIFEEVVEKSCFSLWMPAQMNWNPWEETHITSGRFFHQHLDVLSSIMQKECYSPKKQSLEAFRQQLPIYEKKLEILQNVNTNSITIIRSKYGCGKSTQVAQFVLDQYIYNDAGARCSILVSEPCDLNAISIAERVALEREQSLGQSVGYATRFKSVYPQPYGSILFCSADIIIQKFRTGLKGISHMIVDEAHIAHSNYNLLLSLLREISQINSSLRIILLLPDMADESRFVRFFPDAVMINMESDFKQISHTFIEDFIETTKYLPEHLQNDEELLEKLKIDETDNMPGDSYSQITLNLVSQIEQNPECNEELLEAILSYIIHAQLQGTILVYLSSSNAVQSLYKRLMKDDTFGKSPFSILQLHPHVSMEEIRRIYEPVPSGYRKIVLATSIAETFAIPDVHFVIDTCRDSSSFYTEPTNEISFASPTSLSLRKSQAGLSRPGLYFSLCTKKTYAKLHETKCDFNSSMLKASLPKAILSIKSMNLGNPIEILSQSVYHSEIEDIEKAEFKLKKWNCLNEDGKLNATGRMIAQFTTNPEVGNVVMLGCLFAIADPACAMAAIIMTHEDIFLENEPYKRPLHYEKNFSGTRLSDHIVQLRAFLKWENMSEQEGIGYCRENKLSMDALKSVVLIKDYLLSIVKKNGFPTYVHERQDLNYELPDTRLPILVSFPLIMCYPNFAFYSLKKQLLPSSSKRMNIDVLSPCMYTHTKDVPSPMFTFSQKIPSTFCETVRNISMISPLSLLIFGCEKIVFCNGEVKLDDWMTYKMESNEAAIVVGARAMIHEMLMIICEKPSEICEETLVKCGVDEPWWNKELDEARLILKHLSRRANRRKGNQEIFTQYKTARRNVQRLKRKSLYNSGLRNYDINRYLKKSPKVWKRMLKTISHLCDVAFTSATTPKRVLKPKNKRILLDDPLTLPAPRRWRPSHFEDVFKAPTKVPKEMKKMAKSLQCPCLQEKKDGASTSLMGCGPNCWKVRSNPTMDVVMNLKEPLLNLNNTAAGLKNLLGSHTQGFNNFRNPQMPIRPGRDLMGYGDNYNMGPGNFSGRDSNWGSNNYKDRDNWGPNNFQNRDNWGSNNFQNRDNWGPNNFQNRDNWGPNNFQGRDFNRGPNNFQGNYGNNRGNNFSNRDFNMGSNNFQRGNSNWGSNNYPNRDFNNGSNNFPNRNYNY